MARGPGGGQPPGAGSSGVAGVVTVADLAGLLRGLRRRQARRAGQTPLTVRELAARTGWSRGIIGEYFAGHVLAPTDRFDELTRLLGASPAEQGALASARDRVEEHRRGLPPTTDTPQPPTAGTGLQGRDDEVPAQLPAAVAAFTGRHGELTHLDGFLTRAAQSTRPGAVVISAVSGTAGVGKTALALHWAHQVAGQFPDGQLYVNLRGFDPTGTVMDPGEAIGGFLDALGTPAERIPTGLDARAGLYRSLLAGRRVLVVLDNASDVEQVRPLLPATSGCLALVTSRHQLTGLAATEGAHLLTLDLLTHTEAHNLLTTRLGTDRVAAEPGAVDDIIACCARLPLALAIAAARASTHPGFSLQVLAKELADEHTLLDALDTGDPATSARVVFSWSYQHLSTSAARLFRLLGLHPGPDIALPAATQLADLSPHQAREALGELTRAHLLIQHTPGRYTFHDLLRAYATELTTAHDPQEEQHTALTRLFDYYLHTAAVAMDALRPSAEQHRPGIPPPALPTPPMADADATSARAWLNTERANLTAATIYTASHGWHTHTTQLATTVLLRYLEIGIHCGDALDIDIYTHVQHAAHSAGDRATEALALTNLGLLFWQQGRFKLATDSNQQALTISREIGDPAGEVFALSNLGLVHCQQSRYQLATEHQQQALMISRGLGLPVGEAHALSTLGVVHLRQGRYQQATDHLEQALTISRDVGYPVAEALALSNLGVVHCQQGRYEQATEHLQQALTISRGLGVPAGEAYALSNLGVVHCQQGRYQQATEHHQHALAISRDIGFPVGEVLALSNLGLVHCRQSRYQHAADNHQQALAISRDIGFPVGEVLALSNLGLVHCRQGRYQHAADNHQQALALCHQTGDRASESQILNGLGETHHAAEQPREARIQHAAALTLATELGDRYEQAHAHHGLACTHHTTGDLNQARQHGHQALTLYTDLDVPDTDHVRTHLTTLDEQPQ